MAYIVSDNFNLQSKAPNFVRDQFATVAAMKAFPETALDDGHISYCTGDGKTYQYKSGNSVDATTGKWREFAGGGGGSVTVKDPLVKNVDGSIELSYGEGLGVNSGELTITVGDGIRIDEDGNLYVKASEVSRTINVDSTGVEVRMDPRGGLTAQGDGLGIDARDGLIADDKGGLRISTGPGLVVASGKVCIQLGTCGLQIDDTGLNALLGTNAPLEFDGDGGIDLRLGSVSGLSTGTDASLQLKFDTSVAGMGGYSGLIISTTNNGLRIDTEALGTILRAYADDFRKCLGITSNGSINFQ